MGEALFDYVLEVASGDLSKAEEAGFHDMAIFKQGVHSVIGYRKNFRKEIFTMKQLNYQTLQDLNYDGYLLKDAPERILQFGEGNFMRAFVDFFIDKMNETADFNSKVVLVQPIPKFTTPDVGDFINEQEGLYTLYLRGSENGQEVSSKRVISCVSRCLNAYSDYEAVMECAKNPELRFITCNTTEAGIVYDPSCQFTDTPANSFPAKLTQFLYKRFETFAGNRKRIYHPLL